MEMISRFTMTYAGLGLLFTMRVIFFLMLQKVFWQVCLDRMLCKDHHCLNFGLYTLVISVFVAVLTYAATGESAGRREMPGLFFCRCYRKNG